MNLRDELSELRNDYGITAKVDCSDEDNEKYRALVREGKALPEGVLCKDYEPGADEAQFYTIENTELSKEELAEFLTYKKLNYLKTIKGCVVFFTVLTIISLVLGFFAAVR